ncbi:efflux RND transporter periplasmic adaptor subunit [Paracoccus sp. IB05]|uniref:efflux RND transporter periplasmic adaptor subunit n=1 Tax=Paracoccus sp. IB05 TaxID=2779367 RepID=UPI00351C795D
MTQPNPPDMAVLARMGQKHRGRRWFFLLLALLAGGAIFWGLVARAPVPVQYVTAPVTRGALEVTVIATGTVQPTTRVEISSELSGTLATVEADYNQAIAAGEVLARLDDTKLKAQVLNSEAQLTASRARLESAKATVTETSDALDSAEALDRRGLNTRSVIIAARAAHDRAVASVGIATADVTLAEANLASVRADLDKAVIRSPIDGIVLDRAAEKGQIVAASLNAPVLFTLAEDLRRMELRVSVDEADIGRVAPGQEASFTVDAWPGRRFQAVITSLRFAPDESTSDVVTYTAVLAVENEELLLRPGMTATATIVVARVEDQLLVPMAALRYAPPAEVATERSGGGLMGLLMPARRGAARSGTGDGSGVWVLRDGLPVRLRAVPGATDGTSIVVTSEDLRDGDQVILSQRDVR